MTDQRTETPPEALADGYREQMLVLDRLLVYCREAMFGLENFRSEVSGTGTAASPNSRPNGPRDLRVLLQTAGEELSAFYKELRQDYRRMQKEAERVLGGAHRFRLPRSVPDWRVDEAADFFLTASPAESEEQAEIQLRDALEAGKVLERECRNLSIKLEVQRARCAHAKTSPEGSPLRQGATLGGRRYYLEGEPVHAGEPLLLLTRWGWIPGRYESSPAGEPLFFCRPLPGSDAQVCIEIDGKALLAWPCDGR